MDLQLAGLCCLSLTILLFPVTVSLPHCLCRYVVVTVIDWCDRCVQPMQSSITTEVSAIGVSRITLQQWPTTPKPSS